jgi:hypothetical protein
MSLSSYDIKRKELDLLQQSIEDIQEIAGSITDRPAFTNIAEMHQLQFLIQTVNDLLAGKGEVSFEEITTELNAQIQKMQIIKQSQDENPQWFLDVNNNIWFSEEQIPHMINIERDFDKLWWKISGEIKVILFNWDFSSSDTDLQKVLLCTKEFEKLKKEIEDLLQTRYGRAEIDVIEPAFESCKACAENVRKHIENSPNLRKNWALNQQCSTFFEKWIAGYAKKKEKIYNKNQGPYTDIESRKIVRIQEKIRDSSFARALVFLGNTKQEVG